MKFGPDEAIQDRSFFLSTFPEIGAAVTGTMTSAPRGEKETERESDDNPMVYRISSEREDAIQWFGMRTEDSSGFRFETGSMGKIMEAMRECTLDLMSGWGIDLERHKSMTRRPKPANDASDWVTVSDYRSSLISRGDQGIIRFRLSIDTDGRPTQCHIQGGNASEALEDYACGLLVRRARFEPVLDKNGEAMESFYRGVGALHDPKVIRVPERA